MARKSQKAQSQAKQKTPVGGGDTGRWSGYSGGAALPSQVQGPKAAQVIKSTPHLAKGQQIANKAQAHQGGGWGGWSGPKQQQPSFQPQTGPTRPPPGSGSPGGSGPRFVGVPTPYPSPFGGQGSPQFPGGRPGEMRDSMYRPPYRPPPSQGGYWDTPSQDLELPGGSPFDNRSPNYGQGSNFIDPTTGQHVWTSPGFIPTNPQQIAGLQQVAAGGGPAAAAAQSALARMQQGQQGPQQPQQPQRPIGYQGGSWVDYANAVAQQYGGDMNTAYQALVDAGMTSEIGGFTAGAQLLGQHVQAQGGTRPNATYATDPTSSSFGGYQLDPNAIQFNPYANQWYTGQGQVYDAGPGGDFMGGANDPNAGQYQTGSFDPSAGYYQNQVQPQPQAPPQPPPQQPASPWTQDPWLMAYWQALMAQ